MLLKLGGISGVISSLLALLVAFIGAGFFGGKANLPLDGLVSFLFAVFSVPFVYSLYKRLSKTSEVMASISFVAASIPIMVSLSSNLQKILSGAKGPFDPSHPVFFVATITWLSVNTSLMLQDKTFPKGVGYLGVLAILLLVVIFAIFTGNIKIALPLAKNLFYLHHFLIVPIWTLWVSLVLIKIKS